MRKLLNTLFITEEKAYISLENENIVIKVDGVITHKFPLRRLEQILSFSYYGATPAFLGECAKQQIGYAFYTPQGKFLARIQGLDQGNVYLRKTQYQYSEDKQKSLEISKSFISGKFYNSREIIKRAMREHPLQVDMDKLNNASNYIKEATDKIYEIENLDSLRGLEGSVAKAYFGVFDEFILNNKSDFYFHGRSRRPPLDNVNALMSFLYSLLINDYENALEGVGLDSYIGFMHKDRGGRKSLALDLVEELRSVMVDRVVVSLINKKMVKSEHFSATESGAIHLNKKGKAIVLSAWQGRKQEAITHPYLKEKVEWGLVPHAQALLLARYLRGDLEQYPPFFWK